MIHAFCETHHPQKAPFVDQDDCAECTLRKLLATREAEIDQLKLELARARIAVGHNADRADKAEKSFALAETAVAELAKGRVASNELGEFAAAVQRADRAERSRDALQARLNAAGTMAARMDLLIDLVIPMGFNPIMSNELGAPDVLIRKRIKLAEEKIEQLAAALEAKTTECEQLRVKADLGNEVLHERANRVAKSTRHFVESGEVTEAFLRGGDGDAVVAYVEELNRLHAAETERLSGEVTKLTSLLSEILGDNGPEWNAAAQQIRAAMDLCANPIAIDLHGAQIAKLREALSKSVEIAQAHLVPPLEWEHGKLKEFIDGHPLLQQHIGELMRSCRCEWCLQWEVNNAVTAGGAT